MNHFPEIFNLLKEQGMAALPTIKALPLTSEFKPLDLFGEDTQYHATEFIMPLYAAARLNFSPYALARIMDEFQITLEQVDWGFDQGRLETIKRHPARKEARDPDADDRSHFDGIVFLQQVLLANTLMKQGDFDSVLDARHWLTRTSTRVLAAISIGDPRVSCDTLITQQTEGFARGETMDLVDMVGYYNSMLAENVTHIAHLPNHSIADFLQLSGAFNPTVLRKRLGSNFFWEAVIMGSLDNELKAEILQHVTDVHFKSKPTEVKQMLMSFDTSFFENETSDRDVGFTVEHVITLLDGTGLSSVLTEEAFLISFLGQNMQQANFSFLDEKGLDDLFEESALARETMSLLWKNPETLTQRLMLSQMHDSAVQTPVGHYKLWHTLNDVEMGPQQIDAEVATRYLVHMVEQLQTFKIAGYEHSADLALVYDDMHASMRRLTSQLGSQIQYEVLSKLGDAERNDLVMWGLDMRELNLTSASVASKVLEIDLGL
jgi:hypothetical protein